LAVLFPQYLNLLIINKPSHFAAISAVTGGGSTYPLSGNFSVVRRMSGSKDMACEEIARLSAARGGCKRTIG